MTRTRLLLAAILMSVSACQNNGLENNPCGMFKPIYLDKQDKLTPNTSRQILEHDMLGHDLCDWSFA